jgi:putative membrane protein
VARELHLSSATEVGVLRAMRARRAPSARKGGTMHTRPRHTLLTTLAAACLALLVTPALLPAATTGGSMHMTPASSFGDREILGVLQTLHLGEVKDAENAKAMASSADVKAYARDMIRDHKKGEDGVHDAVRAVGTTRTSTLSKQLAADGRESMERLSREKHAAFDRAYIADEVKMHQMALETIDKELMPKATSDQVKDLLTSTRAAVAEHLQKAQALQAKLG